MAQAQLDSQQAQHELAAGAASDSAVQELQAAHAAQLSDLQVRANPYMPIQYETRR